MNFWTSGPKDKPSKKLGENVTTDKYLGPEVATALLTPDLKLGFCLSNS
jgi:hypothetical protein